MTPHAIDIHLLLFFTKSDRRKYYVFRIEEFGIELLVLGVLVESVQNLHFIRRRPTNTEFMYYHYLHLIQDDKYRCHGTERMLNPFFFLELNAIA